MEIIARIAMARMTSSRENPPLLFGCLFICGPPSHPFYGAVSSDVLLPKILITPFDIFGNTGGTYSFPVFSR